MSDKHTELLQHDKVVTQMNWKSYSIDELAEMQNVQPIEDVESFLGGWPGDVDDGFEEEIIKLRRHGITAYSR